MRPCLVAGCGSPTYRRNDYCLNHWRRFKRYGHPTEGHASPGSGEAFLAEVLARTPDGQCVYWPFGTNGVGYGILRVGGRRVYAHRLVCERTNGPAPSDYEAAHSCGNGHLGCVAPWHLSWKTRLGNSTDAQEHGTIARGSRHGRAKLTENDVLAIRALALAQTQASIATQYGIARQTVGKIIRREKWGWL